MPFEEYKSELLHCFTGERREGDKIQKDKGKKERWGQKQQENVHH